MTSEHFPKLGIDTPAEPWLDTCMTNTTATAHTLYDALTADPIGPATAAQVEASDAAGDTGVFIVDADGDPVACGSWAASQPGTRQVYTLPTVTNAVTNAIITAIASEVAEALTAGTLDSVDLAELDTDRGLIRETADGVEVAVWVRDGRVVAGTQPDLDGPEFWAEVDIV